MESNLDYKDIVNTNSSNKGMNSKTSSGGEWATICTYTPEPPACLEGNHNDSTGWSEYPYSNGAWSWNESCATVWVSGGGETGSDPDSGNGDGESGGTTSSGTDCTYVSGTSIVDSQPITGTTVIVHQIQMLVSFIQNLLKFL